MSHLHTQQADESTAVTCCAHSAGSPLRCARPPPLLPRRTGADPTRRSQQARLRPTRQGRQRKGGEEGGRKVVLVFNPPVPSVKHAVGEERPRPDAEAAPLEALALAVDVVQRRPLRGEARRGEARGGGVRARAATTADNGGEKWGCARGRRASAQGGLVSRHAPSRPIQRSSSPSTAPSRGSRTACWRAACLRRRRRCASCCSARGAGTAGERRRRDGERSKTRRRGVSGRRGVRRCGRAAAGTAAAARRGVGHGSACACLDRAAPGGSACGDMCRGGAGGRAGNRSRSGRGPGRF